MKLCTNTSLVGGTLLHPVDLSCNHGNITFSFQIADDTLQQCLTVVTSTKILLLKCQDIQCELASVLDGQESSKSDGFYGISYQRASGIVVETGHLIDAVCSIYRTAATLSQGTVPLFITFQCTRAGQKVLPPSRNFVVVSGSVLTYWHEHKLDIHLHTGEIMH